MNLKILDYNVNSYVIKCKDLNVKIKYNDSFKQLGSRWSPRLKCGSGWIFNKAKVDMDKLRRLVDQLNAESGDISDKDSREYIEDVSEFKLDIDDDILESERELYDSSKFKLEVDDHDVDDHDVDDLEVDDLEVDDREVDDREVDTVESKRELYDASNFTLRVDDVKRKVTKNHPVRHKDSRRVSRSPRKHKSREYKDDKYFKTLKSIDPSLSELNPEDKPMFDTNYSHTKRNTSSKLKDTKRSKKSEYNSDNLKKSRDIKEAENAKERNRNKYSDKTSNVTNSDYILLNKRLLKLFKKITMLEKRIVTLERVK
jgi:hypothetical protein